MRIKGSIPVSILLALCLLPAALRSQAPAPTEADAALAACLAGAAPGSTLTVAARETASTRAERLWRAAVAHEPSRAAPKVSLARVLVQCRLPLAAGPADMLGLFQEGVEALQAALALEPGSWSARLTLGLVYAGAPEFLGYTDAAITALERAAGPDGIPADRPELADALDELARLYDRNGRAADAAAARHRAAQLRPRDGVAPGAPAPPAADDAPPMLAGITITAAASSTDPVADHAGRVLTTLDVVTMPGGAADLMQVLQVLPGVTGGSESSDLSLRGGDPYEAPVFLNGARLAYAGKFESLSGSLFGVLDPDVLQRARVHPAGFSAQFGDALSGIIEAEAVGRPAARSRRYALNTAGVATTVMSPLGERAGAWASARFTQTTVMLAMQGRGDSYASNPLSLEGIAGATLRSDHGELRAVGLIEHDAAAPWLTVAGHHGAYRSTGSSAAAVLSARQDRVGPLSSLRASATLSSRSSGTRFGALDFSRRLMRAGLRVRGEALVGGTMLLRGGVEGSRLAETLDGTVPTSADFASGAPVRTITNERRHSDHAGAFTEALLVLAPWLTVTPGLRVDRLPGEGELTMDPRLAAEAKLGRYSLTAAVGVFQQGSFRPEREAPGLDQRTGVARRARHVVLGAERSGAVTVRSEVFYKRYDRFGDGDSAYQPASGSVLGGELFLDIPGERRGGRLAYTAMRARLELPGGASIPARFDVTHSVVAAAAHRLGTAWEVGATLRLSSGRPYTALLSQDTTGGAAGLALGPPNGQRYPTYRRLDARVSRYTRLGSRLVVTFAELLNLEGRGNVVGYGVQTDAGRGEPITTFYGKRTAIFGVEIR